MQYSLMQYSLYCMKNHFKVIYQIVWYSACAFLFFVVLIASWFSRKNMVRSRILTSARAGFNELFISFKCQVYISPYEKVQIFVQKIIEGDSSCDCIPKFSFILSHFMTHFILLDFCSKSISHEKAKEIPSLSMPKCVQVVVY